MSVTIDYVSQFTIGITLTGDFVDPADATVTLNGLNTTTTLDATTTPAVTKATAFNHAMSAGAGTINLASLPGLTSEEVIDGTGLKVQVFKFKNPSTNSGTITIVPGASNGYNLLGSSMSIELPVGAEISCKIPEGTPDIASGARTIDISGTGTDELSIAVGMG